MYSPSLPAPSSPLHSHWSAVARKAREQLMPWQLGERQLVVQVDPFFLRALRVWEPPATVLHVLRTAVTPEGDKPENWEALGRLFEPVWAHTADNYAGKNLITTEKGDDNARAIEVLAVRTLQPWFTFLEVNQVCNLKCDFCYVDKLPHIMGKPDVVELGVQRLAEVNTLFVNITGGEPSLYKPLVKLIRLAIAGGLAVNVRTNMVLPPRDIESLAHESRVVFVPSWHHADDAEFDRIVGKAGSLREIANTIRYVSGLGLKVRPHIVVKSDNIDSLPRMVDQMAELGVPYTLTDHVMPFAGLMGEESSRPLLMKLAAGRTRELLTSGQVERKRNLCTAAQSKLWLACNGEVFPCELFRDRPIGNYLQHSIREIIDANAAWRERVVYTSEPKGCQTCKARGSCPRCPAMIQIEKATPRSKHEVTCRVTAELHGLQYRPHIPEAASRAASGSLRVLG